MYLFVRFITRYLVAIVITGTLWTILAIIGWTGPFTCAALISIGVALGLVLRRYSIEGELAAKAEIDRRRTAIVHPHTE
jgi:hypothetical protein